MKTKLVALFAIAFMTASCCTNNGTGGNDVNANFDKTTKSGYHAYGTDIEVVLIDSCEYLYSYNFNATWMTHKGNCKNPIHICE